MRDFVFVFDLVQAKPDLLPEVLDAVFEVKRKFGVLLGGVLGWVWDVGGCVGARGAQFGFDCVDGTAVYLADVSIPLGEMHRWGLFCVELLKTVSSGTR